MGGRIFHNGRTLDRAEYISVAREVTIIGRNTALSTIADIWPRGTTYNGNHTLQAQAGITLAVSSISANDAAAGTGARTIMVLAVCTDGLEHFIPFTLNGTAKVTDTSGLLVVGVNSAWVVTAGSGNANAGKIYIYDSTDTDTSGENITIAKRLAIIDTGDNWARCGFYTVPSLYDFAVLGVSFLNQDATTTIKYGAGSMLSNYLILMDSVVGSAGGLVFYPFDCGQFASSGPGPSEIPAANILDPLLIVKGGGTLNFQAVMSAAPTAVDVWAWGWLLQRTPNLGTPV